MPALNYKAIIVEDLGRRVAWLARDVPSLNLWKRASVVTVHFVEHTMSLPLEDLKVFLSHSKQDDLLTWRIHEVLCRLHIRTAGTAGAAGLDTKSSLAQGPQ